MYHVAFLKGLSATRSVFARSGRKLFCLLALGLALTGQTQELETSDNFNDGQDISPPPRWLHYDPGASAGQVYSWSFPNVGPGDKAYRIIGPPLNCIGDINRGGSYRTEQYAETFQSLDIYNYNTNQFQNFV